jgi:hypothetical protein
MEDESISTFAAITGASPEVARGFLGMTGNDVERAIELFFENPDLASSVQTGMTSNAPSVPVRTPAAAPPAATRSGSNVGRQDSSGVIHIDSDDDNDMIDIPSDDEDDDDRTAVAHAAALAQEEEDAAMAKRLQEELYGGPGGAAGPRGAAADDVRAPIARTTETLVAPDPTWVPGGGESSFESPFLMEHMRSQRRPRKLLARISYGDVFEQKG